MYTSETHKEILVAYAITQQQLRKALDKLKDFNPMSMDTITQEDIDRMHAFRDAADHVVEIISDV